MITEIQQKKIRKLIYIITAILISLIFVYGLTIVFPNFFKKNDIPVLPYKLEVTLSVKVDSIELQNAVIKEGFAKDYQAQMEGNFYRFVLQDTNGNILLQGVFPQKKIIITERYDSSGNEIAHEINEEQLESVTLALPYFESLEVISISDENNNKITDIRISGADFTIPELGNTCGDGVCTDNENLLMCYTDCKYLLPKWMPK